VRRALALVVLAACSRPTEVLVTVDTPFGVPCTIDTLAIDVTAGGRTATAEAALDDGALPGSFAIVPDGDASEASVTVTGLREGAPFASGADTVTFSDGAAVELRFVLDHGCVPGPCAAVGVGGFDGLPPAVAHAGCGADAYGRANSLFVLRDACANPTAQHVLVNADEAEVASPFDPAMPFPFHVYGRRVQTFWVGDNGYVAFSDDQPHATRMDLGVTSAGLDENVFPVPAVLPFWDDLRTGPNGVCLATTGVAPDRILWVTWEKACFRDAMPCGGAVEGTLTFSVALEETTDNIYVGYQLMEAAGGNAGRQTATTATIGLTAGGASGCPAGECSADGRCGDGTPCGYTQFSSQSSVTLPNLELVPR